MRVRLAEKSPLSAQKPQWRAVFLSVQNNRCTFADAYLDRVGQCTETAFLSTSFLQDNRKTMKQIRQFFRLYLLFLLLFLVQKPIFLLLETGQAAQPAGSFLTNTLATMWHGLSLDLAMAAYLTAVPGLLLMASVYVRDAFARPALNVWLALEALLVAVCWVLNLALYPYWGFPLDATPLFYFLSSPTDALASAPLWMSVLAFIGTLLLAAVLWLLLRVRSRSEGNVRRKVERRRWAAALVLLLLTALLFLPIRGGVTVSTNNTGRAYFSQSAFLNHAAVNPMFSLMESLLHAQDFASQYRFMDDAEATRLFRQMVSDSDQDTQPLLRTDTFRKGSPDILIVIMEGFASDLMASLGGQHPEVAVQLDSIARSGVLFTHFYANSFRTDRGLVSILSGYPAQPTMTIMRYTDKAASLPSLARTLSRARGYHTAYYYGGDADFANQRAYLVSQGYETIVSDADFPIKDKLSKWGVHDHIVADRLLADLRTKHASPMLRVLQTSSSHEPFDVPYSRLKDARLNAFAYTDSVVGSLVRAYRKLPQWRNVLIVLVPDHVGGYKERLDNADPARYQIPLILTGGVIDHPQRVDAIGSQIDIAATLLAQLGISHKEFTFSKNLLSPVTPKLAFFTIPDLFGMVTAENTLVYDNPSARTVVDRGARPGYNEKRGQAYLQKLYDDIASR